MPSSALKADLDTPCLVLDLDVLEENLRRMQEVATRAGKRLRPHAKTHKCSALARQQIAAGAVGVCVAKVSEAEALARAGVGGILITGPVVTAAKIARLVEVLAVTPSLMAVVDHAENVERLAAAVRARGLSLEVLLDLDVGLQRTGVRPAEALALAERVLAHDCLRLRGIQAYAGQVQHIDAYAERERATRASLAEAVPVFRTLQARVQTCDIFSASGTGTFDMDLAIPEITELQVGSYACMDAEYLAIEAAADPAAASPFGPALRLLTTVVSANQPGFVTVDAGLKTLYRHGGVPQVFGSNPAGLTYDWFGDEYGKIACSAGGRLPAVGTVLELVTSHCDPTINLFDRFYLTRADAVVGTWPIDLRGCSQ